MLKSMNSDISKILLFYYGDKVLIVCLDCMGGEAGMKTQNNIKHVSIYQIIPFLLFVLEGAGP